MNYITIVSRTDFFLSLTPSTPPLNAFASKPSRCCCLLQMYLLKEFLLPYAVVRNSPDMYGESIVRWTESPHSSFHWLSRKRAIEQNKKALSSLIWISFCSVNHHYLSGRIFPPPRQSWFFPLLTPLLCLCGESVFTSLHTWEGEKKLSEN